MRPREAFGVVVRSVGLVAALAGGLLLFVAALYLVGGLLGPAIVIAVPGFAALIAGVWFLRGAEAIVGFAFAENVDQLEH
jgi:hypothetical protein